MLLTPFCVVLVSQEEEREMKYRRYYQRVLKDRLTALRKVRFAGFCDVQHVVWVGTRNQNAERPVPIAGGAFRHQRLCDRTTVAAKLPQYTQRGIE